MIVTALSPQFVTEPLPGEEDHSAKKTADKLSLKLLRTEQPEATAASQDQARPELTEETRAGLMRLSKLLREKKTTDQHSSSDHRRRRGLHLYRQNATENVQDQRVSGRVLNRYV